MKFTQKILFLTKWKIFSHLWPEIKQAFISGSAQRIILKLCNMIGYNKYRTITEVKFPKHLLDQMSNIDLIVAQNLANYISRSHEGLIFWWNIQCEGFSERVVSQISKKKEENLFWANWEILAWLWPKIALAYKSQGPKMTHFSSESAQRFFIIILHNNRGQHLHAKYMNYFSQKTLGLTEFELMVVTSKFVKQLAQWVQNCKAVLILRRGSCKVLFTQVMMTLKNVYTTLMFFKSMLENVGLL